MACVDKTPIIPFLGEKCSGENRANFDLADIMTLIYKVFVILEWLTEIVAIILLIYAAILYFTAYGDEAKAGQAKKIIISVVIGVLVIILARWFVYLITGWVAPAPVENTINQLTLILNRFFVIPA